MSDKDFQALVKLAESKGYKWTWLLNLDTDSNTITMLSLLQKWLRDTHKIHITIDYNKFYPNTPFEFTARPLWIDQPIRPYGHGGMRESYESALLHGINAALQLI